MKFPTSLAKAKGACTSLLQSWGGTCAPCLLKGSSEQWSGSRHGSNGLWPSIRRVSADLLGVVDDQAKPLPENSTPCSGAALAVITMPDELQGLDQGRCQEPASGSVPPLSHLSLLRTSSGCLHRAHMPRPRPPHTLHTAGWEDLRIQRFAHTTSGHFCSKPVAPPLQNDGPSGPEVGFNAQGRKTLAHPDYGRIQELWHPTKNWGEVPANFTHGSYKKVWLRCTGCQHGCGRLHQWEAKASELVRSVGHLVCPKCDSGKGGFCPCRSVENHPALLREWHPTNPHPSTVSMSSSFRALWTCPKGHPPFRARCRKRSTENTGCPVCGEEKSRTTRHPALSERQDLAEDWVHDLNGKVPSEVTLGSGYKAWWKCSYPEHPPWLAVVADRALKGNGCRKCMPKNRFKPRKFGPVSANGKQF